MRILLSGVLLAVGLPSGVSELGAQGRLLPLPRIPGAPKVRAGTSIVFPN